MPLCCSHRYAYGLYRDILACKRDRLSFGPVEAAANTLKSSSPLPLPPHSVACSWPGAGRAGQAHRTHALVGAKMVPMKGVEPSTTDT